MADNVTIPVKTRDSGGFHVQAMDRMASGGTSIYLDRATRSDVFTATGNGVTVDVSAQGMSRFAMQAKATGAVTSWTVLFEVSLDGTNWVTLLTLTNVEDGQIVYTGAVFHPSLFFRSRCSAITLGGGTNVTVTIVGMP
jgi:hypothetical protein